MRYCISQRTEAITKPCRVTFSLGDYERTSHVRCEQIIQRSRKESILCDIPFLWSKRNKRSRRKTAVKRLFPCKSTGSGALPAIPCSLGRDTRLSIISRTPHRTRNSPLCNNRSVGNSLTCFPHSARTWLPTHVREKRKRGCHKNRLKSSGPFPTRMYCRNQHALQQRTLKITTHHSW